MLIYIPLWFYFYKSLKVLNHHRSTIYIPLWFYFYSSGTPYLFDIPLHLHSTMVLLLSYPFSFLRSLTYLFTFHYGSTSMWMTKSNELNHKGFTFHYGSTSIWNTDVKVKSCTQIYIPLWFYFYGGLRSGMVSSYEFTFHYGSTSIIMKYYFNMIRIIFTFHYGSTSINFDVALLLDYYLIYIPLWFYFYTVSQFVKDGIYVIYIPLWFYFYDVKNGDETPCITIYIPLWFYFYTLRTNDYNLINIFTFHYGSTSMKCLRLLAPLLKNLHSTMVLLLCQSILVIVLLRARFTFHYGSTSIVSVFDFSPICFIYIPLWFYFYKVFHIF